MSSSSTVTETYTGGANPFTDAPSKTSQNTPPPNKSGGREYHRSLASRLLDPQYKFPRSLSIERKETELDKEVGAKILELSRGNPKINSVYVRLRDNEGTIVDHPIGSISRPKKGESPTITFSHRLSGYPITFSRAVADAAVYKNMTPPTKFSFRVQTKPGKSSAFVLIDSKASK